MLSHAKQAKEKGNSVSFEDTSNDTDVTLKPESKEASPFDDLFQKEIKIPKSQVSIYLDEDVIKGLMKFGKAHGKGARSEVVNNFLRKYLTERNYMK